MGKVSKTGKLQNQLHDVNNMSLFFLAAHEDLNSNYKDLRCFLDVQI